MAARGWKWPLERLPSPWNHVIETETFKFKALKHVPKSCRRFGKEHRTKQKDRDD